MHAYRAWPFLSDPHHPALSAVWAVLVHGTLSVIVVLPILLHSNRRVFFGALAFVSGSAFDLDHVVAAGAINPRALEHLSHRPDTHSLLAALALTLVVFALTRRALAAWSVFAIVVAHVLFDAAGGTEYWLYPLQSTDSIPWLACPLGIVMLTSVSWVLARSARSFDGTEPELPPAHADMSS
jgi:membrane-bound metal-dependent hydrolase YbcI (DUF457 family)